jgi:hypothetical protein
LTLPKKDCPLLKKVSTLPKNVEPLPEKVLLIPEILPPLPEKGEPLLKKGVIFWVSGKIERVAASRLMVADIILLVTGRFYCD